MWNGDVACGTPRGRRVYSDCTGCLAQLLVLSRVDRSGSNSSIIEKWNLWKLRLKCRLRDTFSQLGSSTAQRLSDSTTQRLDDSVIFQAHRTTINQLISLWTFIYAVWTAGSSSSIQTRYYHHHNHLHHQQQTQIFLLSTRHIARLYIRKLIYWVYISVCVCNKNQSLKLRKSILLPAIRFTSPCRARVPTLAYIKGNY